MKHRPSTSEGALLADQRGSKWVEAYSYQRLSSLGGDARAAPWEKEPVVDIAAEPGTKATGFHWSLLLPHL